jgi:hypothetical protein
MMVMLIMMLLMECLRFSHEYEVHINVSLIK